MKKAALTLLLLSAHCLLNAQTYSYMELSLDDGFPSTVNSIFVEKNGFAWLGAGDGLYLLYGNNSFSKHDLSQGYLPGNNILQVKADDHGTAWMLTDGGFIGYNSRLNIEHPSIITGLDGYQVAYSVAPSDSLAFFGGRDCIWKYDHSKSEFSKVCDISADTPFKVTDIILAKRDGALVIGAFCKGRNDYYLFDAGTGSPIGGAGTLESGFCAGYSDSKGYAWISLFDKGVFRMAPDLAEVTVYDAVSPQSNVLCFAERSGKIWMGTDGGGIEILDPLNGTMEHLDLVRDRVASDPVTTVSTLFCDHNGHLWCGRPNGGVLIISETRIEMMRTEDFSPAIDTKGISYFYQDANDDDCVWVGTYGSGLLKYCPKSDKFTRYPSTDGLHIYSMARVDDDTIALSCPNKGFFYFDKRNGAIREYEKLSEYKYYFATGGDGVYIENDVHGNILLFDYAVKRWNKLTGTIETFTPELEPDNGYLHPVRGSMCQYVLDFTHIYKWNESLPDRLEPVYTLDDGSRFYCSTMDRDGNIWLGAGERICRFDTQTHEMTVGAHIFDVYPTLLFSADNGRIWVGSRNALYAFNPISETLLTLGEVDGVADNEYVHQAKLQTRNGDIYLGGSKGMVRVHSDFAVPSSPDPEIVVSGVNVDGEEVFDFGGLTVPARHGTVDVRFLVRSSDILASNMYRIHVDGPRGYRMDEETAKPVISFRRLDAGHYDITLSSTARDGHWTEPAKVYSFDVARPWYRSWWATAIFLMLLALTAHLAIQRLSRRRNEAREKESGEERYNFLINVSHELRTPLTLILGPLRRMLNDDDLTPKHRESIKRVCRQADRMATLLNTVLTTNKIENGATEVHPRPVPLNDWLSRCAEEFTEEAQGRDMPIVMNMDPSAASVLMDPDLCRIVFSNIMSNALRHNNPGHPITVWSSAAMTEGFVRVGVRDHGTGIGNVDVSKLFERYYRATEDRTGFGIGLSYAKTIIDAHGGKISAFNNEEDQGATFWFELPCAGGPVESDIEIPDYVSKLTKSILAKDLKDKTILFVDDSADLRDYVKEELSGLCKNLLLAYNGNDALHTLVDHEVDVVIADVMMPEVDGITLCRTIKSSPDFRHIPVILLSARADEASKSRGYAAKADHYLSKPFDIKELVAILDNKVK